MGADNGDRPGPLHLPPAATSAARARCFVADVLRGADERLIEDAVLLVDELVANALVHAGTPIDVSVTQAAGYVRIEVTDGTIELPQQRDADVDATSGRGLALVDRIASGGWGVDASAVGKTVWFALRT